MTLPPDIDALIRAWSDQYRRGGSRVYEAAGVVVFVVMPDGSVIASKGATGLEVAGMEPGDAVGTNLFVDWADDVATVGAVRRVLDGEPQAGWTSLTTHGEEAVWTGHARAVTVRGQRAAECVCHPVWS